MGASEGTVKANFYIRKDQNAALKEAASKGSDPRGSTMSEIVQELLDEAGYAEKGKTTNAS